MSLKKKSRIIQNPLESCDIVKQIVDDIITAALIQTSNNVYKLKAVAVYHEVLKQALEDILYVYDKPKPSNDHSHVVEAWKRDKPAKPSAPDSLIKNLL